MFQFIEKASKQKAILKRKRDLLLSRLMSGRLAVEDLDDIRFPPGMVAEESP